MANWLNKYEQGGMVLKKKTKDNYDLKANPNNVSVSVGPNFVGEGTFNGPKFKNPAWGGQFAMGGSLPGATGFMYARVGAPSNGPYAKKTKASAEDGTELPKAELTIDKPQVTTSTKSGTKKSTTKLATKKEIDSKKKLTEEKYYNPDKPLYKSGNLALDVLSSNPWLMNLPIIGDKIKDQAYALGVQHADARRTDEELANPNKIDDVEGIYYGGYVNDFGEPLDLVKTYIYGNGQKGMTHLPNSPYTPKDDYYEFLPTYSLKERLGHPTNADLRMSAIGKDPTSYKKDGEIFINPDGGLIGPEAYKDLMEVVQTHKPKYYSSGIEENNFKDLSYSLFYKNGDPDLAHYKSGFGYDEDVNLPYAFLSDAWDFYPKDYGNFWDQSKQKDPKTTREYQQSYLMHKVGKPFKIYERTYIDPENKTLVSDKEILNRKAKKKFTPTGLSAQVTDYLKNKVGKSYNPNMQNGGEMEYYQNGLDFKPKTISKDGIDISKNLKKQAEEFLAKRNANRPTVSQYTPKKGEQEKWNKEKLQRIADENALLNKMAASKGAKNLWDAGMFALDVMGTAEGLGAAKNLLKKAPKFNLSKAATTVAEDDAAKAVSNSVITRGPINYWEEPGFAKRNPNFNPDVYANSPVGNSFASREIPEGMAPYLTIEEPSAPIYTNLFDKNQIKPKKKDGGWLNKYK